MNPRPKIKGFIIIIKNHFFSAFLELPELKKNEIYTGLILNMVKPRLI